MSHMQRYSHPLLALSVLALGLFGEAVPAAAQRRGRANVVDPIEAPANALVGADVKAAARGAEMLGSIIVKEPRALDVLLDALALGLAPEVTAAALTAVAAQTDARAFDTVEFFTRYRDDAVRTAAMRAMGALDDRRAAGPVLRALRDRAQSVREVAIGIVAARDLRMGIEPMVELLKKGEPATVPALAKMAGPDLALVLGELIGEVPAPLLANTFGGMLAREDFGPETARVQVVRALGKVPGGESVAALRAYVASLPADSPRQSRREAQALIKELTSPGGGKKPPASGSPPASAPPASPGGTP
jgi:HEAT repeat protein